VKTRDLTASRFAVFLVLVLTGITLIVQPGASSPLVDPVDLGTAGAAAVLGGATVTNTGPSVINGDLGVSPGSAVTGFPPGIVVGGAIHAADAVALQAKADLTIAYDVAAGRASDVDLTGQDLGGLTLTEGVHTFSSSAGLTGTLTLDAEGNPHAVFIFQIGSTLTTASNSTVSMVNGAQACNVFWQVGSSATLGTDTTFVGNILALTSIAAQTGSVIDGGLLARNGEVTLDNNVVRTATCAVPPTTTSTAGSGPTTTAAGGGATTTSIAGVGAATTTSTAPASATAAAATTMTTAPGANAAASSAAASSAASSAAASSAATTTRPPGAAVTPAAAGASGTTTTTRAVTSTTAAAVTAQQQGASATTSQTTPAPTPTGLPRTGGRSPLITLALGLLLIAAGIAVLITGRASRAR